MAVFSKSQSYMSKYFLQCSDDLFSKMSLGVLFTCVFVGEVCNSWHPWLGFALLVEQPLLDPWCAPIPAALLSHRDPLLGIAAMPLPLQVKSNIFNHGSFPASSKPASFLLLHPEFMKLFPKLNSCT